MNVVEMKYLYKNKLDAVENFSHPGYVDREITQIFNDAQDRVFFKLYNPLGNKYQKGFEYDEKRRRDLAELINATWIPLYDDTSSVINSNGIEYKCNILKYTDKNGISISGRKIIITSNNLDIDTVVDSNVITSTGTKVLGLTPGMKIISNIINSPVFTGSGLDDLTVNSATTVASKDAYVITIDTAAGTNTFKWSKNGVEQATGVNITGAAQILDNGVQITFAATTGHTLNEYWTILTGKNFEIVNIISEDEIELNGDATGMTLFNSGLGLSTSQYGANVLGNSIKGYFIDLPVSMLYTVEEGCVTSEEPRAVVSVKPQTHDFVLANKNNPYKKPYKNLLWRLDIGKNIKGLGEEDDTWDSTASVYQRASSSKRIEIISDKDIIPILYYIKYIKYPRRMNIDEDTPANNVNCELDESIHSMIVDEAVKITIASTQPEKYQIGQAETQSSE